MNKVCLKQFDCRCGINSYKSEELNKIAENN